jgi:hypothetical protein
MKIVKCSEFLNEETEIPASPKVDRGAYLSDRSKVDALFNGDKSDEELNKGFSNVMKDDTPNREALNFYFSYKKLQEQKKKVEEHLKEVTAKLVESGNKLKEIESKIK